MNIQLKKRFFKHFFLECWSSALKPMYNNNTTNNNSKKTHTHTSRGKREFQFWKTSQYLPLRMKRVQCTRMYEYFPT